MRRKLIVLGLVTMIVCLCLFAHLVETEQRDLAGRLIRLHIVASADTPQAQSRKLAVRDALLPVIARLTEDCPDQQAAAAAIRKGLPELAAAADDTLSAMGCAESVSVRLGYEYFPRRSYDTFSLPAGRYETLRVVLGEGLGHNWWCVAFPALCLPATAEEFVEAAEFAGFSEEQRDLLCGESVETTLKFYLLDWFSVLFR